MEDPTIEEPIEEAITDTEKSILSTRVGQGTKTPDTHEILESARNILYLRLLSFMKNYEQISTKLEHYIIRLETYSINGLYQDKRLNQPYSSTIQTYRMKLQSIRVFILRINDKLSRLQCR